MRYYHHYGIPITEKREDETLIEVGGFKFYSTHNYLKDGGCEAYIEHSLMV